jgi:hypothetical protein
VIASYLSLKMTTRNLLFHIGWLIVLSILYGAIFLIPLPPQFKRQGIFIADEFITLVLLIILLFAYSKKGWWARYVGLAMLLIAFSLPLLRLWETAESTWNIILGLLPWADATGYYLDASSLIEGKLFSVFSGRRPLYASLLAVFLKLSNQNLQIVLITFTIINGLIVFLFAEEIRNEFGSVSAIVAIYLSHFFYRPFVGTTLTEQLGFPIGLVAFVVLIRAVKTNRIWLFALGMMLVTFALLVRAGTFFVLPILGLFGVFNFAMSRQQQIRVFLIVAIAVVIPITLNAWLGRAVASPDAIQFGNFADTLYGQAKGGIRWTQAMTDHPELASMEEPYRSRKLYQLALEEIIDNPSGLVRGSVKAWKDFIAPGPQSAFGFLVVGNKAIDMVFQLSASVIFLAGLWLIFKDRNNAVARLMLAYCLGTLVSIPFLPPIDAGIRPYAATIASVFLPVIFVFSGLLYKREGSSIPSNRVFPIKIISGLALVLLLTSVVGAPLIKFFTKSVQVKSAACQPEFIPIHIKLFSGSYIVLVSTDSMYETRIPVVSIDDVHRSFDDFPYGDFASVLRKINQPGLVASVNDLSTGAGLWVVAPVEFKNYDGQIISACAEMVFPNYSVLFIRTFEKP